MNSMLMPPVTAYPNKPERDGAADSNPEVNTQSLSPSISTSDKYITFKLANYLFALPSEKILKVVTTPPPSQGGMVSMGLVQLEQYSIQTLDLPAMMNLQQEGTAISGLEASKAAPSSPVGLSENNLTQSNSSQSNLPQNTDASGMELKDANQSAIAKNPPFLMVLQDAEQSLWGIAVSEAPDLMNIPQYALKPVPSEKRLTRALRWISHVVTYDLGGDRHTLLVLDLSVLLSTKSHSSSTDGSRLLEIEPPVADTTVSVAEKDEPLLGIEPPLELSELEVDSSGRTEEMYA